MALSDEELLDFDERMVAKYDAAKARRALEEHGDAFRYQLIAARHMERWADSLEKSGGPDVDKQFQAGYIRALREVSADLRQGDYLPGGLHHDDIARES